MKDLGRSMITHTHEETRHIEDDYTPVEYVDIVATLVVVAVDFLVSMLFLYGVRLSTGFVFSAVHLLEWLSETSVSY